MDKKLETAYIKVIESKDLSAPGADHAGVKDLLTGRSTPQDNINSGSPVIRVQFNPSTLDFSSGVYAESQQKRADISKNLDGRVQTAFCRDMGSAVSMSAKLVFDRTTDKDDSVQPDVEHFIDMVRNPFVRRVAFYWGDTAYQGVVRSVDAEYVQFSPLGKPTRAFVSLTLEDIYPVKKAVL